jgi:hypothetical protein
MGTSELYPHFVIVFVECTYVQSIRFSYHVISMNLKLINQVVLKVKLILILTKLSLIYQGHGPSFWES